MSELRVGSLCSGIGGLELGIGGTPVFFAETAPGPSQVLAEHWPDVPNLGDWTTQDLPDCDLLIAGLPCQPVSTAGRRAGTADERWLFDDFADAVGRMGTRPDLFLENVPGLLSADGGHALARCVHGLARIGYVGSWRTVRASDVGACHRRARWFCIARHPDRTPPRGIDGGLPGTQSGSWRDGGICDGLADAGRPARHTDSVAGETTRSFGRDERQRDSGDGPGSGAGHSVAAPDTYGTGPQRRRIDDSRCGRERPSRPNGLELLRASRYGPAVERWEHVIGRPAPDPLDGRRLNPVFVEWMMGFPEGWTGGLKRTARLTALGNAVVPLQAAAAFALLRADREER